MLDLLGIPALWDRIVDFFTISPWWLYLFWGVVISLGSTALAYFFPPLRSLAGAVVIAISTGLYAYRRAEYDTEARLKKKKERERQRQNQPDPWRWW